MNGRCYCSKAKARRIGEALPSDACASAADGDERTQGGDGSDAEQRGDADAVITR